MCKSILLSIFFDRKVLLMKDIVITFKVDEEMKEQMKICAKNKDIPVSQMIREAIRKYMQEANDKNE